MTTALYLFYARAAALLAFLFLFVMLFAGIAFAQDAGTVQQSGPSLIVMLRDSFAAALIAIVGAAITWLSTKASSWLGGRIDLNATLDAMDWENYVKEAAHNAFASAQSRLGITPDKIATLEQKADFLSYALRFIHAHNSDIVQFADKNGNGVIDLLEAHLARLAPALPVAVEEPPTSQMGLMGAGMVGVSSRPVRRAPPPPPPPVPPRRRSPEPRPLQ